MYKGVYDTRAEGRQQGGARAYHETGNGRLKDFGVLFQVFRHEIGKHEKCFFAVAVIVQLSLQEVPSWKNKYDVVYKYHQKPPADFAVPQPPRSDDDDSSSDDESNNTDEDSNGSSEHQCNQNDTRSSIDGLFGGLSVNEDD